MLCRYFQKNGVCRPDCQFAHGACELRAPSIATSRGPFVASPRVVQSGSAADAQPVAWQSGTSSSQGDNSVEAMDGGEVDSWGDVPSNGGRIISGGDLATQHRLTRCSPASLKQENANHRYCLEFAPRSPGGEHASIAEQTVIEPALLAEFGGAIGVKQGSTKRPLQPDTSDDRTLLSLMLLQGRLTPTDRSRHAQMLKSAMPTCYED
eukprot:CAMPEP_0117481292 /NCGR_PEP_ID=MMETSP0784-20121206/12826_1 /TAXON_ID=39447 /ORGANISM="" /LENGTH=207 /DNA_ID=CAMNT_0005275747 /DNA_START=161 /DNA_END=784 /DNA_ORIENTATION=+